MTPEYQVSIGDRTFRIYATSSNDAACKAMTEFARDNVQPDQTITPVTVRDPGGNVSEGFVKVWHFYEAVAKGHLHELEKKTQNLYARVGAEWCIVKDQSASVGRTAAQCCRAICNDCWNKVPFVSADGMHVLPTHRRVCKALVVRQMYMLGEHEMCPMPKRVEAK